MPAHHGMNELPGLAHYCHRGHQHQREERFGRLLPDLPPSYVPADLLRAIGAHGGPMDGGNGSSASRSQTVPVGQVIFGQFIDHDITLDVSSSLDRNQVASAVPNARTPRLDLDCIYGAGPEAQPYLYAADGAHLLTGADVAGASAEVANDLLRSANGRAMIGDPRNDENRIVSQMQLAMIKFHNALCDELASSDGLAGAHLYEEAKRAVTWHYQWCVVFDFLVAMCGQAVVDDILYHGRKLYCAEAPYIPVEFAVAAYRFGHSMVPMKLQVQKGGNSYEFFGTTLGRGFSPVGSVDALVDWHELFDTPAGRTVQRAEKLDTKMASDLLDLPFISSGESSLASRNLLRGSVFLLPAGEAVAAACGRSESEIALVLDKVEDVSAAAISHAGLGQPAPRSGAPLWLYVLAEAEVIGRETSAGTFDKGEGLGPTGARIVAEVLIGLLELDEHSFLGSNRNWVPRADYNRIGKLLASTNASILPS
ncbi:peroxidase family protein [Parahaliea mediterranea]|uniref:peroxidase family protein n=1 Tax=Parahaliea mediterranea TaxID=651086 RepID=UPI0019D4E060|nr:heme peroxidase family protein [Parahaliea mediterranea]